MFDRQHANTIRRVTCELICLIVSLQKWLGTLVALPYLCMFVYVMHRSELTDFNLT
jgi:hypothetical protein